MSESAAGFYQLATHIKLDRVRSRYYLTAIRYDTMGWDARSLGRANGARDESKQLEEKELRDGSSLRASDRDSISVSQGYRHRCGARSLRMESRIRDRGEVMKVGLGCDEMILNRDGILYENSGRDSISVPPKTGFQNPKPIICGRPGPGMCVGAELGSR